MTEQEVNLLLGFVHLVAGCDEDGLLELAKILEKFSAGRSAIIGAEIHLLKNQHGDKY